MIGTGSTRVVDFQTFPSTTQLILQEPDPSASNVDLPVQPVGLLQTCSLPSVF